MQRKNFFSTLPARIIIVVLVVLVIALMVYSFQAGLEEAAVMKAKMRK